MSIPSRSDLKTSFASEADLCQAFIKQLPDGWTAYPETGGFDILLSRAADGAQIGIEAKKRLTAEVLVQAGEKHPEYNLAAPDFRAVLVPDGAAPYPLQALASRIWITVIQMKSKEAFEAAKAVMSRPHKFHPELPKVGDSEWRAIWFDCIPTQRIKLPEYIPDVQAGIPGPVKLSEWKIKAIKICILLERRGFLTRADFKAISIDHRLWLDRRWLGHSHIRGQFVGGTNQIDLRAAHPRNYSEIEADFDKWSAATVVPGLLTEGTLL